VPAWVVVAPPDFVPGSTGIATQFDVLFDRAIRNGSCPMLVLRSFQDDVLPILNRIAALQWISGRAMRAFAPGAEPGGYDNISNLAAVAKHGADGNKARARVFAAIVAHCLPSKAGDSPLAAADEWRRITPTQLAILRQWAASRFKADWPGHALDAADIPAAPSRRGTIDRAILEACVGGILSADPERRSSISAERPVQPRPRPDGLRCRDAARTSRSCLARSIAPALLLMPLALPGTK